MNYSQYQKDIFTSFIHGNENIIVNATAGSGKTTTSEHAIKQLIDGAGVAKYALKVIMVAFNVKIKEEFERRLKGYADCKTVHGLGFSMVPKPTAYWKIKPRSAQSKMYKFTNEHPSTRMWEDMKGADYKQQATNRTEVFALMSMCKNNLIDWNDLDAVRDCAKIYDVPFSDLSLSILGAFMKEDMELSKKGQYDFDDLIYLPVVCNSRPKNLYTHIIVDETQDLNKCQIELLKKCIAPNGKFMFVGDSSQSMYAFRGADPEAMQRIQKEFNCKQMPLSISYRCPVSHIELARQYTNTIEPRENAPEGIIETIEAKTFTSIAKSGELCLARCNAPLIGYALTCISLGKKCKIIGKEIGEEMIDTVKNFEVDNVEAAIEALNNHRTKMVDRLNKQRKDATHVEDNCDCILMLLQASNSLEQYYSKVKSIFDQEGDGIIFSTVHRAKGLENDNVYILHPDKIPLNRPDQTPMQVQQERNIAFVAYTRSKNRLVFVTDGAKK